jgi:hypothetical protein
MHNRVAAVTVTDGSYKASYGMAAWALVGEGHRQLSGQVIVPGKGDTHSSYRSKLAGIYTTILIVTQLCKFYEISQGNLTIACDSESALDMAFNSSGRCTPEHPSFDLLRAIAVLLGSSLIEWEARHVRGHQDQNQPRTELSLLASLNGQVDQAAKDLLPLAMITPRHFQIYHEPWSIGYNEEKLLHNIRQLIYEIHTAEAESNWMATRSLTSATLNGINWQALVIALSEVLLARCTFIMKHIVGMCGVNKFLKRWKESTTTACP